MDCLEVLSATEGGGQGEGWGRGDGNWGGGQGGCQIQDTGWQVAQILVDDFNGRTCSQRLVCGDGSRHVGHLVARAPKIWECSPYRGPPPPGDLYHQWFDEKHAEGQGAGVKLRGRLQYVRWGGGGGPQAVYKSGSQKTSIQF